MRTLAGFRVGHASDIRGLTGCTVVLCEPGAVCGVDIRGSAAGTREIETCRPGHLVERIHAILLTGGSAFGLDATGGVLKWLEERGVGFQAGLVRVPIVPAAVIFDLNIGSAQARPGAAMAEAACRRASARVEEGSVGAGTGATVGKLFGPARATKGGVGFWGRSLPRGAALQALTVVNAFGDVVDPAEGTILAGARRSPRSSRFIGTLGEISRGTARRGFAGTNTTLVVVMTNVPLDKVQATKLAQMAHDGLALAIRPVHTQFDGDLVFALSMGTKGADLNALGAAAVEATARAVVRAVTTARSLGGVPGIADWRLPNEKTETPASGIGHSMETTHFDFRLSCLRNRQSTIVHRK